MRKIILDRPDVAVRTLQDLASLVGDEDVFVDLVKVYALRDDTVSALRAADRLFRVHDRIVPMDVLTLGLKSVLTSRSENPDLSLTACFIESYWATAACDDSILGAAVVKALCAEHAVARSEGVMEQLLDRSFEPDELTRAVEILNSGDRVAEGYAVKLALGHFEEGEGAPLLYPRSSKCKSVSVGSPFGSAGLSVSYVADFAGCVEASCVAVGGTWRGGRAGNAGELSLSDVQDPQLREYSEVWWTLTNSSETLRDAAIQRNPEAVEMLDALARRHRQPGNRGIRRRAS